MIQSYPLSLAHPSEFSRYHVATESRSPSLLNSVDETQSTPSEQDEGSMTSSSECCYEDDRSSPSEDSEEKPLNLSCKQKNVDNSQTVPPKTVTSSDRIENRSESLHPLNAMEQAVLQYRAQVLASNDLLRVLAQQRLQESLVIGRTLYPPAQIGANLESWIPGARYHPYQNTLYTLPSSYFNGRTKPKNSNIPPASSLPSSILSTNVTHPLTSSPQAKSLPMASMIPKEYKFADPPTFSQPSSEEQQLPQPCHKPFYPSSTGEKDDESHPVSGTGTSLAKPDSIVSGVKRKRTKRSDGKGTGSEKESFPCSICGASYPHKFELNRHIKVSHVRPHRCGQCGKGFGHRNYLKVHIETVHLGQKSHQCRLCGKYLSTGGNLNVHIRTIHYGEKKYNCPICNRSFGQQCNMKTHKKRHEMKPDGL